MQKEWQMVRDVSRGVLYGCRYHFLGNIDSGDLVALAGEQHGEKAGAAAEVSNDGRRRW